MFDAVHAALDLQPTGPLFAQAAEAGLSHQATLRHVISSAARRAGLPAIPTPFAESIQRTIFMTLPPPRVRELLLLLSITVRCLLRLWSGLDRIAACSRILVLLALEMLQQYFIKAGGRGFDGLLTGGGVWMQDFEGELDAQLAKDEVYTEEGLFNEALVERPAYDEPPKRQRRIMDPNATFVPVSNIIKSASFWPQEAWAAAEFLLGLLRTSVLSFHC